MTTSKNIISIIFVMFMMGCSYSSLRPEVVDRSDAQRMQTVIFATVVSIDRVILSGDGDTGAGLNYFNKFIRIFFIYFNIKNINICKDFKQECLTFHNWL